jgi:hypothetical protein
MAAPGATQSTKQFDSCSIHFGDISRSQSMYTSGLTPVLGYDRAISQAFERTHRGILASLNTKI